MPDFEGKPIRKRGYYRAVKRGDKWAVEISKRAGMDWLFSMYFRNIDFAGEIRNAEPLFKNLRGDTGLMGGSIIVPLNLGSGEK